ncbi:MAG TPA: FHA domain-containing protein, partial [Myxococcaceae bacterium]|nr:FHA domain-containing protein [Myxococcaceae bacterium]
MERKSGGEKVDGNETERLSGLSRSLVLPDAGEPGVVLCVRYPEGFQVVPLTPGAPVVLGRSGLSTVRIDHRTLSREHARFALADGRLTVEDLGSKNGTYLAGVQVQRAELDVGDEVRLGSVEVSVQLVGPTGELLGVDGERHFMRQLEAELSRASELRRPFALLAVRSADADQERAGARESDEARPVAAAALAQHWVPKLRAY